MSFVEDATKRCSLSITKDTNAESRKGRSDMRRPCSDFVTMLVIS